MPPPTTSHHCLRVDRPVFQKHNTFPLSHAHAHAHTHPSEHVPASESIPEDWVNFDDYPSPSSSTAATPAPVPALPGYVPGSLTGTRERERGSSLPPALAMPLELMSPSQRFHLQSDTNRLLGLDHLEVSSEEIMYDDRLVPPGVGEEGWEHDGYIERSQSDTYTPVPLHKLAPLPSAAAAPSPAPAPTTGHTTDTSPESAEPTPLIEQQRRRRAAQQARLVREATPTPVPNTKTPAAPGAAGETARDRLLMGLADVAEGRRKRSFANLGQNEDDDDDEEEEEMGEDPRKKLFSPRLSAEKEEEEVSNGLREREVSEAATIIVTRPHRLPTPPGAVRKRKAAVVVEDDSPYKTSEHSGNETDGASAYSPSMERAQKKKKAKGKRGKQTRAPPYHTHYTRTRPFNPAYTSSVDHDDEEEELENEPEDAAEEEEEEEMESAGLARNHQKVRDFARYLVGPKRLREPRFDMRIFHWAMSGCAELKWEKSGDGVVIPDIDQFYKNVLHKEAKERKALKGMKASKKDLPQKNSFERQLSGYGFARSSHGKTMHIRRLDLQRSDTALLARITKAWDELKSATRPAKLTKEPKLTAAYYRKQASQLEVEIAEKDERIQKLQSMVEDFAREYDPTNPVVIRVKREFPEFDLPSPETLEDEDIKSPIKPDPSSSTSAGAGTSAGGIEIVMQSTPLKSIDDHPKPITPMKTRKIKRVKREKH